MIFTETKLKGVFVIQAEKIEDERGFFARMWCEKEFKAHGLSPNLAQISVAFNKKKGTIRGMHYQKPPHEEAKLVYCTKGKIYDVVVDLRPASKTFKDWFSIEIQSTDYKIVYVPRGCAHGYQTLEDNTDVIYQMSTFFMPEYYAGVRWNDPAFKIKWPYPDDVITSKKDRDYLDFKS